MAATYWRLYISEIGGLVSGSWYPALSGILFYDDNEILITSGGTASASSSYSGSYTADNAFDVDESNDWASVANDLPAWIQYQFSSAQEVTSFRIICGTGSIASPTLRAPTAFVLQSSSNGTSWTDEFTYADITWSAASQNQYFGTVGARAMDANMRHDTEDYGVLKIVEPVTLLNTPVARRVRLCDQASGRLAREEWSDADTGDVTFDYLREGPWVLYALDHTGEYEAVAISDRLATTDGERP